MIHAKKTVDELMTEIGLRLANQTLGKPLDDDDVDDIIADRLGRCSQEQRFEVADIMVDLLAVADLLRNATSDGNGLDEEEVRELAAYVYDIEYDTKSVMKQLVA